MTLRVQLFGILAQQIGSAVVDVTLPDDATVGVLVASLAAQHAPVAAMQSKLAVAVNLEYAGMERMLLEGDEVALIPPVSGG